MTTPGSRRRGIRRIITKAVVFLLLGAVVNVAVAWECAILDSYGVTLLDTPAGWPLHSLSIPPFVDLGWTSFDAEVITITPLAPGFAINTLFYAAILWLLFAAPFALRRWRRVRRGLCPACAYPVGESAVCTRCGGPVTAKLKAEN